MKCFTSYQRLTADTVSGEQIVMSTRYSTFDKQEMDAFEETLKQAIGSGVVTEINMEMPFDNGCDICEGLEDRDTLYSSSDWDGGIGFDYIRDIHFCPKCGRKLP